MKYLHTMIRIANLTESLAFYTDKLGLIEVNRQESEQGQFTLIFLCAPNDQRTAEEQRAPLIELTYNWPDQNGNTEKYTSGRNFGHLAFEVDDIYLFCQNLEQKGVDILRPPRDGRMAFIKSPDGISIELLQKGKALPSQEPWASRSNQGSW